MAHLGKDGVTVPFIHHSWRLALTGVSSSHLIPFPPQRELTAACRLVDPKRDKYFRVGVFFFFLMGCFPAGTSH